MTLLALFAFLLYAGGRPSKGTSKDKRLKENKPVKAKGTTTKVTPRKGVMTRAD